MTKRSERHVQVAATYPYSLVQQIDNLAEAAGLNTSEIMKVLVMRGLESLRSAPELAEISRQSQIKKAAQLVGK